MSVVDNEDCYSAPISDETLDSRQNGRNWGSVSHRMEIPRSRACACLPMRNSDQYRTLSTINLRSSTFHGRRKIQGFFPAGLSNGLDHFRTDS